MDADRTVTATFTATGGGDVQPSNEFQFGKPKRNRKRGTAKLPVRVPGAGLLELRGKGLKRVRKQRPVAGTTKLAVKPKGRLTRKLKRRGTAKPRAKVTFTPTGGEPNTESKRVRLKKR
jgi:hypothetical protein